MGQVVEHEHEVGLDEGRRRHAGRIRFGKGYRGLEDRHGVVGQRAHRAAGEARHPVPRRHAPAGHERTQRGQWIGCLRDADRQVRRVLDDPDRSVLDPGMAGPNLQQAAGPHAEEGVAPEALPALDGFEEVGRRGAVVEPQEGADRGLEVGRAGGAQEHGVGGRGVPLRLGQAERVRAAVHRRVRLRFGPDRAGPPENQETTFVPRDERPCLPRCHPHSAMPHSRDRRVDGRIRVLADRRCPVTLALCAGAYWDRGRFPARVPFGPEAPGSIRRRRRSGSHQPPDLCADARRVLVPFTAVSSVGGRV